MKKLILILVLLAPFSAQAVDVTFTWGKPVPAFTQPVPPDWIIDEYRIYCNGALAYTVQGYDTESFLADLAPGQYDCYMTSFSAATAAADPLGDGESAPSATVSHFVHEGGRPNVPSAFDFSFDG